MGRIRTIKPEFFRHADLYDAEKESGLPLRVAFAGLWTAADREGRFRWKPRELKLECLPHDELDFLRVLDALVTRGFVVRYVVDGVEYGRIPSWKDHQAINNRESASKLPAPPDPIPNQELPRVNDASSTRAALGTHADTGEGKGREGERERKPTAQAGEEGHSAFQPPACDGSKAIECSEERLHALRGICIAQRIGTSDQKSALLLRQWTSEGVTDAQLMDAVHIARKSKRDEDVNVAYLAPIVAKLRLGLVGSPVIPQSEVIARTMASLTEASNAAH